ncbi:hypothetical protein PCE1_001485 [Barthelona sp. PCE]
MKVLLLLILCLTISFAQEQLPRCYSKDGTHNFMMLPQPIATIKTTIISDIKLRLLAWESKTSYSSFQVGVAYKGIEVSYGQSKSGTLTIGDDDSFQIGEISSDGFVTIYGLWCMQCGLTTTMGTELLPELEEFFGAHEVTRILDAFLEKAKH